VARVVGLTANVMVIVEVIVVYFWVDVSRRGGGDGSTGDQKGRLELFALVL
jgi:hypothetical protein